MFEIAYTFRGSILFSFSTANIVTLEEKFKKWGNFLLCQLMAWDLTVFLIIKIAVNQKIRLHISFLR